MGLIISLRNATKQANMKDEKLFGYIDKYVNTLIALIGKELEEDDKNKGGGKV
jgi:hypothetical protein